MKNKISVICCYNNSEQYLIMKKSLMIQDVDYELIGLDNREGFYKSAAHALNAGAKMSAGDILVFIHQDIIFDEADSLRRFCEPVLKHGDIIVGLFGASRYDFEKFDGNLYKSETLDECCICMPRNLWESYKFNEEICNGWHCYAVEFCLRVLKDDVPIVWGEFSIRHLSTGTVDDNYMRTFKRLLKIYKSNHFIATTCKRMPTNLFYFYIYYFLWKLKKLLTGNYPLLHSIKKVVTKGRQESN